MKFDLTSPCDTCPFRTDRPFALHPARAREIADALVKHGQTFQCHKTVDYGAAEYDDEGEELPRPIERNAQHCAGAAITLEHMGRPNQWMQICERMGWRDPARLDMTAPVFRTTEEFVRAMEKYG